MEAKIRHLLTGGAESPHPWLPPLDAGRAQNGASTHSLRGSPMNPLGQLSPGFFGVAQLAFGAAERALSGLANLSLTALLRASSVPRERG